MSWGNGQAVQLLTMYLEFLVELPVLIRIMELLGNNSGAGLWFANWTDNFYLNGTSNNGSSVVSTMSSPFLISFSKIVRFDERFSSR